MNLFFRLIYIYCTFKLRPPCDALGPCETVFRCWPTDIDILRHMNNGKYFSIMDLARVDLMARAGLLKKFSQLKWYPVVVAETGRFKKSIKLFDKFTVETSIIGWDEKAILVSQKFYRTNDNVLYFEAVVRGRFLKKSGGSVSISDLLKEAGIDQSKKIDLEPWLKEWNLAQI